MGNVTSYDRVILAAAAAPTYTGSTIGTVPTSGVLYVRCPVNDKNYSKVEWLVSSNKAHTIQLYKAMTVANTVNLDISAGTLANTETIIVNGLTYTAHTDTTVAADRQFSIAGNATADGAQLALCLNYATTGLSASNNAGVVTVTPATGGATVIQAVTGTAGGKCVVTSGTLLGLEKHGAAYTGKTDNSTYAGDIYEQWVDGYPYVYLAYTSTDANPATVVIKATRYRA